MPDDPIPAVSDADATGETAEIFADLRKTLGVDVVNLIWRHLATYPGALPWAWATVKPIYVSGLVGTAAQRIKAGLAIPELPGWPRVLLRSSGIDAEGEASIRRILASYNHSNALNLAAFSALLRRIDGVPAGAHGNRVETDRTPEPAAPGALPKLLALEEVSADTADLIRRINLLGDRGKGRIVASLYRHVAHWPGFLALSYVQLAPLAADDRLDGMIGQAIALGENAGTRLQAGVAMLAPPESLGEIRSAIATFLEQAIGRMVPIGALLMASLPPQEKSAQ